MRQKTLLIIGAGVEQVPIISLAKKMGLYVVASDMNPNAIGFRYCDNYIIASTYDPAQTIKEVKRFQKSVRKIDGVMTAASDVPLTVATVAKAFDLPGNSIETATLAQNKLLMKEHFKKYGVPIPRFSKVNNSKHLKQIVSERGLPLVLKPVDSRGARGVLLLTPKVDLEWAYQESKNNSPTKSVMVEEFLEGPQISTESFIYDGFSITPGIADRNYEYLNKYAPNVIENGGEVPSTLSDADQIAIKKTAEFAGASLGIKRNSSKGDMVLTKSGPKVIEIAARLSGGYFATHSIPLTTGVNLVEQVIKVSLGIKPSLEDLIPHPKGVLIQRFFFPKTGRLKSIEGVDRVKKFKFVKLFNIYVKPGDTIEPIVSHTKRAGVFIVLGKDHKEALENAQQVQAAINFVVK